MDYVKEELLRQKRALEGLMGGRGSEREAAEQEESVQPDGGWELSVEPVRRVRKHSFERNWRHGGKSADVDSEALAAGIAEGKDLAEAPAARAAARGFGFERQSAAEVRALSRAVQRDARRYDGGFSMY